MGQSALLHQQPSPRSVTKRVSLCMYPISEVHVLGICMHFLVGKVSVGFFIVEFRRMTTMRIVRSPSHYSHTNAATKRWVWCRPYLLTNSQNNKNRSSIDKNFISSNTINSYIRNNDRCFVVHPCRTDQLRNSFFCRTVVEWNHLDNNIVHSASVNSFRTAISQ